MSEKAIRTSLSDAVLVVIDMQEKLMTAMYEMHRLIHHAEVLVRGCALLGVPVIFTQQYTKGLGATIDPIKDAYLEVAGGEDENIKLAVEDQFAPRKRLPFSFVEKTSFSAMDEPVFVETLERTGRREVIVCGIESHVCVMQSAEDMVSRGYVVRVAADASDSRREADSSLAYSRMANEGITVTTSEALLFDLMRDSKHPMFRNISALVK
jgi:nicotinamidase-related amidase